MKCSVLQSAVTDLDNFGILASIFLDNAVMLPCFG